MRGVILVASVLLLASCGLNYGLLHPRARTGHLAQLGAGLALAPLGVFIATHLLLAGGPAAVPPLPYRPHLPSGSRLYTSWHESIFAASLLPTLVFSVLVLDKGWARALGAYAALAVILTAGLAMAVVDSLALFFLCLELLLLSSLFLLLATSKADRITQALTEMFLWTLAGSLALLAALTCVNARGIVSLADLRAASGLDPLVVFLLLFGFAVKLPVWPCYSWLLRAHVEASVEFSILLSGVIVKFGALGLARILAAQPVGPATHLLLALCLLAMFEATLRLLAQRDLKRIVALTTVIEMNWVGFSLACGGATFFQTAGLLLVAHSFATTGEFFITEVIYRRFHSRDITQLGGLHAHCPSLWALSIVTTLTTIGFPGTSLFAAKVSFLAAPATGPGIFFVTFTCGFMLLLPLVFIRIRAPLWFGSAWAASGSTVRDITGREAAILLLAAAGSGLAGLMPHLFLGGCLVRCAPTEQCCG